MRVLFVSKPVVPPFHDGTKCLVRDIALSLERVQPIVLSSKGAPSLGNVELVPVYDKPGGFAPGLAQNLRAAAWLLLQSRADVWHFVYAPNLRTSRVGRLLRAARAVPVVQTIASPPRAFDAIDALLFGDIIVAQSRWTHDQVIAAYRRKALKPPRILVIPPPVSLALSRSAEEAAAARASLGIPPDAPLFVYPGDLEVSSGARFTAELSARLAQAVPGAITVFAYRRKTGRAEGIAQRLRSQLDPASTRVAGSIADLLALVASAAAVVFPVDDLWGKVDLPIVLLEAMVLGIPVVALGSGPLADLDCATLVGTLDPDAWIEKITDLATNEVARDAACERQRLGVLERHSRSVVARAYEELYLELGSRGPSRRIDRVHRPEKAIRQFDPG